MWADHTEILNEYFWMRVWLGFSRTQTNLSRLSHALAGDENYKYVDISTFQKTHNQELGGEILVFLCWLRVGNYSLCLHQRPICGLQAADGEGGLCYYNFTKLLQLLEAVLRLFVRAQDELRAALG